MHLERKHGLLDVLSDPYAAQAIAGVAPTVIESRSKDWVTLLLGFCAAKGSGGSVVLAGRRNADSDDEDAADGDDAALAGEDALPDTCLHAADAVASWRAPSALTTEHAIAVTCIRGAIACLQAVMLHGRLTASSR